MVENDKSITAPNFVKLTKMSITSVCDVADEMSLTQELK